MRKRLLGVAAAIGALLMMGAAGAAMAEQGVKYRIMPGDRLAITVFGHEPLSGKFLVDSTGAIDYPVIGRLPIGRLTMDESRIILEAELSRGIVKSPAVNIRIEEYRPVYVFGHVKTPGAYPFRPSLTAVGAMIVAGGEPKFEVAALTAMSDLIGTEERVSLLASKRNKLLINIAGLEAQREGRAAIDLSFLTPEQRNSPDIQDQIAGERKRFEAELAAIRNELALLQGQKPLLTAERQSLQGEIEAQRKLLAINRARLAEFDKLSQKGLSRTTTIVDLTTQQAFIEGNIGRLSAAASRNELEQSGIELKKAEKMNLYSSRVMALLTTSRQDLAETDILLQSARNMRELRRQAAGFGRNPGTHNYGFVIFRPVDGRQERIEATAATLVEPGDIVEVKSLAGGDPVAQPASTAPAGPRLPINLLGDQRPPAERRASAGGPGRERCCN